MLSRTETYSTTGTKASWNCDPSITPFNMNVVLALLSGTVSYKLQYSYDTLGPTDADTAATWFDSTEIPAATAASAAQQFTAPVTMIRVVIAAITGSLKMTMLQGISTN